MPKLNLINIIKEPEVEQLLDPFAFEKYCGNCDNFCDPIKGYSNQSFIKCPREGKVTYDTDWTLFNCKYFSD
jgi:hypothetical protein